MFVSPIKGRKAKTVSCQDAVTNKAKKAEVIDASFKSCIDAKICTPVDAETVKSDTITKSFKTASVSKSKYYKCKQKDLYIHRSSRHVSDDLKLEELFKHI